MQQYKAKSKAYISGIALFIVSATALVIALFIQYVLGVRPCPLCLFQRVPYYVISACCVVSLSLALLTIPPSTQALVRKGCWFICLLASIVSIGLGVFHFLVESGTVSYSCSAIDISTASTVDGLRAMIDGNSGVSCQAPSPKVLGIPMVTANILTSLLMLLICIIGIFQQAGIAKNSSKR